LLADSPFQANQMAEGQLKLAIGYMGDLLVPLIFGAWQKKLLLNKRR
jgi:hypothetical protein